MKRIAMWSGPRNISTAMMYSFASRSDCAVWDEPFYGFYLAQTGHSHPLGDEVMAANSTDFDSIKTRCLQDRFPGKDIFYQKHMCHHMLDGFDHSFLQQLTNAFLIRHPQRVLASYAQKRQQVSLEELGFVAQAQLFDIAAQHTGTPPIVIDSDRFLQNPETMLKKLTAHLEIPYDASMLNWPQGPKPFDGVWAPHWYNAVWQSTGFAKAPGPMPSLPDELQKIADAAMPYYQHLKRHAA